MASVAATIAVVRASAVEPGGWETPRKNKRGKSDPRKTDRGAGEGRGKVCKSTKREKDRRMDREKEE